MNTFDARCWNLWQAAAWVVFRSRRLVEYIQVQSRDGWVALFGYPSMHSYRQVGATNELQDALVHGKLVAWGRRNNLREELESAQRLSVATLSVQPVEMVKNYNK